MCLAIPMKVVEIHDADIGIVDLDGARQKVDLSLIEAPECGDYVIVHAGFAIEKLDEQEANERIGLFEELAAAMSP